jgi:hypothetical protein
MASLEYLLVCDYAFAAQNGKACIIGVFQNVLVHAVPSTHPIMSLAVQVKGEATERVALDISIRKPSGGTLMTASAEITLGDEGGAFIPVSLVGTVFPELGRYQIGVSAAGRLLGTAVITVRPIPSATQG